MGILPSGDPVTWSLGNIRELMANVINLALLLAGGIAVILIIWGGYGYLTSFGNDEKAANAKKVITWALIGLAVIILSKVIISELWNFLQPSTGPVEFPT